MEGFANIPNLRAIDQMVILKYWVLRSRSRVNGCCQNADIDLHRSLRVKFHT
ncbi:hypothetical protein QUA83_09255 [Microcoleus sp. K1-B1]|uniref:hypothetical protein n=1 Tax=Microcoleus sp. K1-B6 TaxID=2818787 RepID=UPI002FD7C5BE